jgi:hypothetical protein
MGFAAAQGAGEDVGLVAQFCHHFQNSKPGIFGDITGIVDDVRDGGRRDTGSLGNLAHVWHHEASFYNFPQTVAQSIAQRSI